VQPRGWCSMRIWVCWRGGSPGASGSNCEAAARVVQQALLGLLVGRQPALHTAEAAAAPDAAGRKRKMHYASGMFSPPGKAVRSRANRPALNVEAIKDTVELTCDYAWHGSGKTQPDNTAAGSGLLTQFESEQGFYGQGNYSAHQASYSHHERYTTGRLTLRVTTMTAAASTFICCWLMCCAASPSRPLRCGRESAFAPCRTNWGSSLTASRVARTYPPCPGRTRQMRAVATTA